MPDHNVLQRYHKHEAVFVYFQYKRAETNCGQSLDMMYSGEASINMDISMDVHVKCADMDMDMDTDAKFHIDGKPVYL